MFMGFIVPMLELKCAKKPLFLVKVTNPIIQIAYTTYN